MGKKIAKIVFFIVLLIPIDCLSQSDVFDIARGGTLENLKELIAQKPDVINTLNDDRNSPLILACYKGNYEVAAYLIKNVKDINYANDMGTALMAATVKNDIPIVKLLLDNNANPDITDVKGTTALHYATIFKNYEIATMLMEHKANVELKDIRQKTAFDYAVIANDDKLINILKTK
ncbi:ankyrin repeat domain-containing protein [Flavobacterium amniphilum]|uniref:ankyrin repeat domain-containing protein n=1 Tax=Flavobacterium amniphilum TaxID=1834035 RepID=UPI002029B71C|nr:ankyrin repeat domain-containing protein [Flavobacterium amniphilum]MCL9806856.1 ankyrin repeat domain-containing protein [Flavobacterium amniphilum]